jgi:DnaK suppressor protein
MEPRALDKFRSLLSEMKVEALESAKKEVAAESMQGDDADIAQHQHGALLDTHFAARNSIYLKRIDAALRRIRSGSFGDCTECEEPIEEQRLELRPITTLCISCKEDEERLQSSFAGSRKRSA